VGVELVSELKVYYRIPLPVRLGIAHGLDNPGDTRAYFMMGQVF
jgi:hypothetical protein